MYPRETVSAVTFGKLAIILPSNLTSSERQITLKLPQRNRRLNWGSCIYSRLFAILRLLLSRSRRIATILIFGYSHDLGALEMLPLRLPLPLRPITGNYPQVLSLTLGRQTCCRIPQLTGRFSNPNTCPHSYRSLLWIFLDNKSDNIFFHEPGVNLTALISLFHKIEKLI